MKIAGDGDLEIGQAAASLGLGHPAG
jgi:hypothetical protein